MDNETFARCAALLVAAMQSARTDPPASVLAKAAAFLPFTWPAFEVATSRTTWKQPPPGAVTFTARATTYTTPGGAVQLHDDEQVTITLVPKDAKGAVVTDDNVTYTPADPTVISCQPAGMSCLMVAGVPGSTTVDISDGVIHFTWAVDVVPGDVATFQVQEGAPEKQPAAPPA